jgi:hypothetical protein
MEAPSTFEVDDEPWADIGPLIPVRERRFRHPGRNPIPDRLALNETLYVLHTARGRTCPRSWATGPE